MRSARTGLWVAALVAFLVPLPVAAQPAPTDQCVQMGDIAERIMREVQHGASMDDLVLIERTYPDEQHGMVEVASIMAVQEPVYDTAEQQEAAVAAFRVRLEEMCRSWKQP